MKTRVISGLLAAGLFVAAAAPADPLDRLDPARYGAGTLLEAMEEIESYLPAQAVDLLLALVGHEDFQVARAAARLLRRMGQGAEGVAAAAAVLADGAAGEEARLSATMALGELRDAAAAGALGTALSSDASEKVRAQAALSLGQLGRTGISGPLQQAASSDQSPLVRAAAVRAISALPDTGADVLLGKLGDGQAEVRREAAWGLGQSRFSGQPAVAGQLTMMLQQDSDCTARAAAAWALGSLGDASARPALEAVGEHPCRLAAQAAEWALNQLK